jgi:hypothetical protein
MLHKRGRGFKGMVRKFLIPFLVCLFVGISGTECLASKPPAPLAVVRLISHPGGTQMMTMRAKVRGHEGLFLFDTGGGISYISPSFAQTVGCKPWGQLSGFMLTGQRLNMPRCDGLSFDVEGQSYAAPTSGVFDIMQYMPPNVPRIDGSIGLDVFAGRAVTLSLAQRTLTVESAASLTARTKRAKEIPIRLVREAEGVALSIVAAVPTPEGTAWMEIDSGNGGANVVAKYLAPLLKLDPDKKGPQPASFELAGGIPVEGDARINDTLIMDGNIGTRFLIKWDLTLDLSNGRAWLAPAPGK